MSQNHDHGAPRPRPGEPIFQAPPAVVGTIATLAAIHLGLTLAGQNAEILSLQWFAFIPARYAGPYATVPGSQIWTFLTYALLHAGWGHLATNCLWLLIFGTPVARFLGTSRYLGLAAAAAIAGAVATLLTQWGEQYIMVGASGAISGLMGAAVPIMYGGKRGWRSVSAGDPAATHPLTPRQLLGHRSALAFTLVWLVITMVSGASGWTGNSFVEEGGIAWEAHIGGFIGGLAAFYLLWRDWMR